MRVQRGDLAVDLSDRLRFVHGVTIIRRLDLGEGVLHRFDPASKTLELTAHLSSGQTVFRMASELAYLEYGDLIEKLAEEGHFTSEESRKLARLGLANYFAAATVLPYAQFHDIAEKFRYDVERLSSYYSVSYETVCHRLSTLQRPSMRGVPFSFVRVDRAGNMSKRQSATGFHFSSSGGTCPLWNVYETFANPGKILVQIAEMPDGRSYMWVARTVERRASRYGQPGKTFAIGLGCELRHAQRLVYSEGLDLTGGPNTSATPDRRRLPGVRARQLPAARVPGAGPCARHRRTPLDSVAVPGEAFMTFPDSPAARIAPGGFKELGPVNWAIAKIGARGIRRPRFSLMNVLGQHRPLFLVWLPLSGYLLGAGKLSRRDAEFVILRVGHLRDCEYELQQHRRLARSRGLDADTQAAIFAGPDAPGLTDRERVLITATDEFVVTRGVSAADVAGARRALHQAAADRVLHSGRAIRRPGRHHHHAGGAAGLPGLTPIRADVTHVTATIRP